MESLTISALRKTASALSPMHFCIAPKAAQEASRTSGSESEACLNINIKELTFDCTHIRLLLIPPEILRYFWSLGWLNHDPGNRQLPFTLLANLKFSLQRMKN